MNWVKLIVWNAEYILFKYAFLHPIHILMDNTDWRNLLKAHTNSSNLLAIMQLANTLIPCALLWYLYSLAITISLWFVVPFSIVMALFLLRGFVLMHDCGHKSFFKSNRANEIVGFILGVYSGIPQYVWSKHHAYHHATNGDWAKYQGPLSIITTEKYLAMGKWRQKGYAAFRHPLIFAPFGGFYYLLFNPRFTWILGSARMLFYIIKNKIKDRNLSVGELFNNYKSQYWRTTKEYMHMFYNNIALFAMWIVMCNLIGTGAFFLLYVISMSLAGGAGLLLFTVQHNFEDSYASDTSEWDYYKGALEGSSYLVLPKLLNWFSADIAYHHVHHLSASVPNYRLASCHYKFEHLFKGVKRITLKECMPSLKYILWDTKNEVIVPITSLKRKQTI